jgi:RNA polymerase sigma-70 factor (ECF subfamily)
MDPQTERRLFEGLRDGEGEAFDRVYDHYRPRLFSFLLRLAKQQEVAEDLLQETWIRLARKAPTLREDTRLGPWLFTVARNLFLCHRRWRLLDGNRVQELFRTNLGAEASASPFEMLAATELERRLERALAALPLKYREVLLLVVIEGMTPAEAAQVCELKPEALRKRLQRAREMLAKHLAGAEGAPALPAVEVKP